MIKLAYQAEIEYNNSKGLIFKGTFVGNYGVNGTGDLLNLNPTQNGGVDGGITDPQNAYNHIIASPPGEFGVLNEDLGGSYTNLHPNAVPTMTNLGLRMFEAGGAEKATGAAYTAAELAGFVFLIFFIPSGS